MRAPGSEVHAEEALRTDAYVDRLLDAVDALRRAEPHAHRRAEPDAYRRAEPDAPEVDPSVALAARALRETLGRAHPSFRFEERLSRRLAELALAMRRAAAVGEGHGAASAGAGAGREAALSAFRDRRPRGQVVAFPTPVAIPGEAPAVAPGVASARAGVRPVIARGAVASAAISIGAAALVAWRRTHVRRGIV